MARALATQPQLLLLDEAIAGLNPTEVSQIMRLIREVQGMGVTIFLIEHVMKAVLGLSDKVIVLNYGEKIAEGPPQVSGQRSPGDRRLPRAETPHLSTW